MQQIMGQFCWNKVFIHSLKHEVREGFLRNLLCLPAQCPEPGQFIGTVNSVTDGNDFLETLDLDSHNLCETIGRVRGKQGAGGERSHLK